MTYQYGHRVKETTTITGCAATYPTSGAGAGFQTFASGVGSNNVCYYAVDDGTNWETGEALVSGNRLQPSVVIESTNNSAQVNWGAGAKTVRSVIPYWAMGGGLPLLVPTTAYTSAGSYVWLKPNGVRDVLVYCLGGGGGGGGGTTLASAAGGAGGGAGGFCFGVISSVDSSVNVTIGASGAGAIPGVQNGLAGGTSSFGAYMTALGGTGGITANQTASSAGEGGVPSGGDVNIPGQAGSGPRNNANSHAAGSGGGSFFGGGGRGQVTTGNDSTRTGKDGQMGGGGGAGAGASAKGGSGGAGAVYVVHLT